MRNFGTSALLFLCAAALWVQGIAAQWLIPKMDNLTYPEGTYTIITNVQDPDVAVKSNVQLYSRFNYTGVVVGLNYSSALATKNELTGIVLPATSLQAVTIMEGYSMLLYRIPFDQISNATRFTFNNSIPVANVGYNISYFNLTTIGFQETDFISVVINGLGCENTCTSNGLCDPSTNTCVCKTGFAGTSCMDCAKGYYGANCERKCECVNGISCDDGRLGSGKCSCTLGENNEGSDCQLCKPGYTKLQDKRNCDGTYCEPICKKTSHVCGGFATTASDLENCAVPYGYRLTYNASDITQPCDDNFYFDEVYNGCLSCSPGCSKCTSYNTCTECDEPIYWFDRVYTTNKLVTSGSNSYCVSTFATYEFSLFLLDVIKRLDPLCSYILSPNYCKGEAIQLVDCSVPGAMKPNADKYFCYFERQYATVRNSYDIDYLSIMVTDLTTSFNSVRNISTINNKFLKSNKVGTFDGGHLSGCPGLCKTCEYTGVAPADLKSLYADPTQLNCTACMHEYALDGKGNCVRAEEIHACPAGQYLYIKMDPATKEDIGYECLPCDISCSTCNSAGSDGCTTCQDGYVSINGVCSFQQCKLPDKPFQSKLGEKCLGCDPTCADCNGLTPTSCTKCIPGYTLNIDGTCSTYCPVGQSAVNGRCIKCPDNCVSCRYSDSCDICKAGYLPGGSGCLYLSSNLVIGPPANDTKPPTTPAPAISSLRADFTFPTYAIGAIAACSAVLLLLIIFIALRRRALKLHSKGQDKRLEAWNRDIVNRRIELLEKSGQIDTFGHGFLDGANATGLKYNQTENVPPLPKKLTTSGLDVNGDILSPSSPTSPYSPTRPLISGASPLTPEAPNIKWDDEEVISGKVVGINPPPGYKRRTVLSLTTAEMEFLKNKNIINNWDKEELKKYLIDGNSQLKKGDIISKNLEDPSAKSFASDFISKDWKRPITLGLLSRNVMEHKQVVIVPFGRGDFNLSQDDDEKSKEQFMQTVQLHIALRNCPNIAEFYGYTTSPLPNIVLSLCEGDLEHVLRNTNYEISVTSIIEIVRDISCGISALHELGFAHGRLRPSAVLLVRSALVGTSDSSEGQNFVMRLLNKPTFRWVARVTDLEMAHEINISSTNKGRYSKYGSNNETNITRNGINVSTFEQLERSLPGRYAAPELLRDIRNVSQGEDSWSIGSITYHCLLRREPFAWASTDFEAANLSRSGALPADVRTFTREPTTMKGCIGSLIGSCWAPEPTDRPRASDITLSLDYITDRFTLDF